MKTAVCIALILAFVDVSISAYDPRPANLIFHPAAEAVGGPMSMKYPEDPAINVFRAAPLNPDCRSEGYFRDPYNCGKFYHCRWPGAIPEAFYCSRGFIFNMNTNWCDYPQFVEC